MWCYGGHLHYLDVGFTASGHVTGAVEILHTHHVGEHKCTRMTNAGLKWVEVEAERVLEARAGDPVYCVRGSDKVCERCKVKTRNAAAKAKSTALRVAALALDSCVQASKTALYYAHACKNANRRCEKYTFVHRCEACDECFVVDQGTSNVGVCCLDGCKTNIAVQAECVMNAPPPGATIETANMGQRCLACKILGKRDILDFGRHIGTTLKDVSRYYLAWLSSRIIDRAGKSTKIEDDTDSWVWKHRVAVVKQVRQVIDDNDLCWCCMRQIPARPHWRKLCGSCYLNLTRYDCVSWRLMMKERGYMDESW